MTKRPNQPIPSRPAPQPVKPPDHISNWIEKGVEHIQADTFNISLDPERQLRLTFAAASTADPSTFVIQSIAHMAPDMTVKFFEMMANIAHHAGIELPPAPIKH